MRASIRVAMGMLTLVAAFLAATYGIDQLGYFVYARLHPGHVLVNAKDDFPASWLIGLLTLVACAALFGLVCWCRSWSWPEELLQRVESLPLFRRMKATPLSDLLKRTERGNRVSKFVR